MNTKDKIIINIKTEFLNKDTSTLYLRRIINEAKNEYESLEVRGLCTAKKFLKHLKKL